MADITESELAYINKNFAKKPLSIDEVFGFNATAASSDRVTSYNTRLDNVTLEAFAKGMKKNPVAMGVMHQNQLPIGRAYNGKMDGNMLNVSFYALRNMTTGGSGGGLFGGTPNPVSTNDIERMIDSGTLTDVSVGFQADKNKYFCNIDQQPIMSPKCEHMPGQIYDGMKCIANIVDKNAILHEVSIVMAGAVPGAEIHSMSFDNKEDWFNKTTQNNGELSYATYSMRKIKPTKLEEILSGYKMVGSDELAWTSAYINNLPDAAFAVISAGGTKDDSGKTTPRSLRHLPHHNSSVTNGSDNKTVDLPHLRNALARLPQTNISSADKAKAKAHLDAHAKALGVGSSNNSALNIKEKEGYRMEHELEIARLNSEVVELNDTIAQLRVEIAELNTAKELLQESNEKFASDYAELEGVRQEISEINSNLKNQISANDMYAKIGKYYDMSIDMEINRLGVALEGNNFDKDLMKKQLIGLSIEDKEKIKDSYMKRLGSNFKIGGLSVEDVNQNKTVEVDDSHLYKV